MLSMDGARGGSTIEIRAAISLEEWALMTQPGMRILRWLREEPDGDGDP